MCGLEEDCAINEKEAERAVPTRGGGFLPTSRSAETIGRACLVPYKSSRPQANFSRPFFLLIVSLIVLCVNSRTVIEEEGEEDEGV